MGMLISKMAMCAYCYTVALRFVCLTSVGLIVTEVRHWFMSFLIEIKTPKLLVLCPLSTCFPRVEPILLRMSE